MFEILYNGLCMFMCEMYCRTAIQGTLGISNVELSLTIIKVKYTRI